LTVGHQATPTRLPIRKLGTVLFPIDETRFVAQMVYESSRAEVRLGVQEGFDLRSPLPGCHVPPHVVCVGKGVGAQVAVSILRLLEYGGGASEELVLEGMVPQT
jgi:hypothetical protein